MRAPATKQVAEIKGADGSRPLWCLRATMKFFDRSARGGAADRGRSQEQVAVWRALSRSPGVGLSLRPFIGHHGRPKIEPMTRVCGGALGRLGALGQQPNQRVSRGALWC